MADDGRSSCALVECVRLPHSNDCFECGGIWEVGVGVSCLTPIGDAQATIGEILLR